MLFPPVILTEGVCLTWGMSNSKGPCHTSKSCCGFGKINAFDVMYSIKVHRENTFQYYDAYLDADVVVSTFWCFSVKNNNTPMNSADRGKVVRKRRLQAEVDVEVEIMYPL